MGHELTCTSEPSATSDEEPLAVPPSPPGYELLDEIGRGGMGVVYRARDVALGRDIAVKFLSKRYPTDSPAAQRFLNEARITGQLQHPGIPAVHQVGALLDGRPFLVMKLIKGNTLADILKQSHNLVADRGKLLPIFEAICQAVGYAHAHQVIHRDLKPANVMVGAFGEVQVMDWGLAKVLGEQAATVADASESDQTRAWTAINPTPTPESASHTMAGSMVGTPAYIPPEQACGEIEKVDERADVFGLGALLAVILTGQPPYVGENFESVRVQAVRGKLDQCFARLDVSGAEPELVSLCKKCLAFEPDDRPSDGGVVAQTVAALRSAAEERARTAELDRVRAEGEKAAVEAQTLERRKRRRLWIGAATALALTVIAGLTAVSVVQAKKNQQLADEQAKVQARFELAQKAIGTFHTGVSEDVLMQNPQLKELQTKLLREAATFYDDMEKLLQGQNDAQSQKILAASYMELGQLTETIGSIPKALESYRKALVIRQALADADPTDVGKQTGLGDVYFHVGYLITQNEGNRAEANAAFDKALRIWQMLSEANPADDATRRKWARTLNQYGLFQNGVMKPSEVMESFVKARAIMSKVVESNPNDSTAQWILAGSHRFIGGVYEDMRKPAEAVAEQEKATAILHKLAATEPGNRKLQSEFGLSLSNMGDSLEMSNQPLPALRAHQQALAVRQKLVDTYPAALDYQEELGSSFFHISSVVFGLGQTREAMDSNRKALAIQQKLADANPSARFGYRLARGLRLQGICHCALGERSEGLECFQKAIAIWQKLVEAEPADKKWKEWLASTQAGAAQCLLMLGKRAEARTICEQAVAGQRSLIRDDAETIEYRRDLAESLLRLGQIRQAENDLAGAVADWKQSLELSASIPAPLCDDVFFRGCCHAALAGVAQKLEEIGIQAEQAMTALKKAIELGYRNRDHYRNEPALDPLRNRDDFRKLMADLEAKVAENSSATKQRPGP